MASEGAYRLRICLHFLLLVLSVYSILFYISLAPENEYVCKLMYVNYKLSDIKKLV